MMSGDTKIGVALLLPATLDVLACGLAVAFNHGRKVPSMIPGLSVLLYALIIFFTGGLHTNERILLFGGALILHAILVYAIPVLDRKFFVSDT